MKYTIAIFDLDGTILNTLEDLADSTNYALKTCGYPERTMDEVRQFVGNGIRKLMERAVPEETPVEEIDRVHETFTAHYKVHCADKTRPYDGIMELLQNLKKDGCKLAVVSNKADSETVKETALREGFVTMKENCRRLVLRGEISAAEAAKAINSTAG